MKKSNTIKEMYHEERPYEKCEHFGAEHLTDAELLAVILRTGTRGENRWIWRGGCFILTSEIPDSIISINGHWSV